MNITYAQDDIEQIMIFLVDAFHNIKYNRLEIPINGKRRKRTMRKKILTPLLLAGLVLVSLTGCQKEATNQETQQSEVTETTEEVEETETAETTEEVEETEEKVADTQESGNTVVCSLCEKEKVCGIYTAEGKEYVVCHVCSNEFLSGFSEVADKQTCSGCQEEKICGKYVVDGQEYFVCPDDYEEFAYGMKLEE